MCACVIGAMLAGGHVEQQVAKLLVAGCFVAALLSEAVVHGAWPTPAGTRCPAGVAAL